MSDHSEDETSSKLRQVRFFGWTDWTRQYRISMSDQQRGRIYLSFRPAKFFCVGSIAVIREIHIQFNIYFRCYFIFCPLVSQKLNNGSRGCHNPCLGMRWPAPKGCAFVWPVTFNTPRSTLSSCPYLKSEYFYVPVVTLYTNERQFPNPQEDSFQRMASGFPYHDVSSIYLRSLHVKSKKGIKVKK